jgi:MFS transporter, FSR family, fosmidomycin resistance protein
MTTASASVPPVGWRDDIRVMSLVGLAHAGSHFSHLLLPVMFPVFVREFGWSYAQLGLLSSIFFAVSGIGQASSGFVVDRVGARPVLLGSLTLFVLACVLAASASSYPAMMMVAVLAGLGNCAFHPVDFSILNQRISSGRLGYAFSVHGLTGNLGWAAAPVFFALTTSAGNWRMGYASAAVMYVLILLLMIWQRDALTTVTVRTPTPGAQRPAPALAFLKHAVIWWCFAFFFLSTFTLAVVQNFSVPILQAMHHVTLEQASMTLTAYMLCGAAGMLLGGFVAARMPRWSDRVVAACMSVAALLMGACATGWLGAQWTMVILAATGFAVGVGGPSRDLMIKKATPKGATGRVYGLVYSGLDAGFAVSPLIFGVLMDEGLPGAALAGAACVLLLSVGAALGVGRRTPHTPA